MNHRQLQAGVDARDNALLIAAEDRLDQDEAIEAEAHRIATEIVKDGDRLAGFIERGDLVLYETLMRRGARIMSIERALCQDIAASLVDPRNGLDDIAKELVKVFAERLDVIEKATHNVLSLED